MDQSNAIMRYVGKLGGLYPSDPVEALEVDLVIDTVEEAYKFLGYTLTGPKGIFFSEDTLSDQEKIDIRKKLMDPAIPRNVAYVSTIQREHGLFPPCCYFISLNCLDCR